MAWILQDIRVGTSQIGRVDEDATVKLGTEMPAYSPVLDEYDDFIYLQGVAGTTVGARVVYDELSFSTILSAVGAGGRVATAMAAVGEGQYGWYRKRFVEPRVQSFYDRDSVVQAFTDGQEFETGTVLKAGATEWIVDNTSTIILDMPGTKPIGAYTPQHFGSTGTYKARTGERIYGWLLSDRFATLAAAQAVYPDAAALTETIDSHAFQRCADALRNITRVESSGQFRPFHRRMTQRDFFMPRGFYVINRPVDMTLLDDGDDQWYFRGDNAVIISQCVGETTFDFILSGHCYMDGWTLVGDLIPGVGCPRSGMLWGRDTTGASGSGHNVGFITICGYFTLGCIHNYASESNNFTYLVLRNALDHRVSEMDYDTATATPAANDGVTWTGGTGTITNVESGRLVIRKLTGTNITDGQTITFQTSQTAVVRDPYAMPQGEGPDGRSYCLVADSSNYWGTDSLYVDNAAQGDAASFTINQGRISCLHSGRGNGAWFGGNVENHWYRGYFTTTDYDGSAGFTIFGTDAAGGPSTLHIWASIESDDGDTDPDTGIAYAFDIQAESAATDLTLHGFHYTTHKPHYGYAVFHAGTNINTVSMLNCDISVGPIGRYSNQVMWDDASKFNVYGTIRSSVLQSAFLNVADLNDGAGVIFCRNMFDVGGAHAFLIYDDGGIGFTRSVRIVDDGTAEGGRINSYNAAGDTIQSYLELSGSDSQLNLNGDTVVTVRRNAVQPLTINYTSGSAPATNGTVTFANSASPTVTELLEAFEELNAKLNEFKSRFEASTGHGLISDPS